MAKVTSLPPEKRGEIGRQQVRMPDDSAEPAPQTVGQYLRAVRLSRGTDAATVARALRIRGDQIEAIEESRVDDLPGRTYAIGFIRSYAGYLGLDPADCVERFKAEIGGYTEQSPLKDLPPDTGEGRLPYGWLLMGLAVLGVVAYAGYHIVRSTDFTSLQPVAPVPAVIAPEASPHASARASRLHQSVAALRPSTTAAAANAPASQVPGNVVKSAATAAAPPPANSAVSPPVTTGQTYGTQNHKSRVVLRARAVTHVLVEGPGGRVYINRVLQPGDAYRVPDLVGLSLTTPDGSAVSVELDGQVMGVAGKAGQMTEALSLDPQAIVDRGHGGSPR